MHHQLANELPSAAGRRALVLSASKELEPGARAMLLHAEGLFRFDVVVRGDSLRTVVRNLSSGPLELEGAGDAPPGHQIVSADATAYQPGTAQTRFTIGAGEDRLAVEVTLATLRFAERGTVRVSAQAIVRQRPGRSDSPPPG